MSGGDRISRRYFVMNSFDGLVTILGVIVGALTTNVANPATIIGIGIGTAIGMMISGFAGTFMAEKAERDLDIKRLKQAMLVKSLDNTIYIKVYRITILWVSFINAISPFISAVIILSPQVLALYGILDPLTAIYYSIIMIFLFLFILGVYLSRITGRNPIINGIILLLVGIGTSILIIFILGLKP